MTFSSHRIAHSNRAVVVSGHHLATKAATELLEAGGSIADAAICGASLLSVALPQACGLGGDAFILVHDAKSGRTEGINASGMSPALATPGEFSSRKLQERGPRSVNVPGMVAGWDLLHQRYGRTDWSKLLYPAVTAARDGVPVSRVLARSSERYRSMLESDPGSRSFFLDNGQPLQEGAIWRQEALSKTLEQLALEGAGPFYRGDIGRSIASACEKAGGLLRASDMAAYQPEWVAPLSIQYRGHEVRALPPNSFGLYLLLQLLALEDSDFPGRENRAGRLNRLIRAARAAFEIGNRAVADPSARYGAESAEMLLGAVGRERMRSASAGTPPNLGGTAVIAVADHSGNSVIIIQSVFLVFGSGISDESTGTLLNNRLFGFCDSPGHPNQVGPHKRPAHTLCPAMVFKDNEFRYAVSTPGGPGQTLTLAQVLEGVIEGGESLADAIATPRWSMNLAGTPLSESSMPLHWIERLRESGIDLASAEEGSPFFGSVKGIARDPNGTLTGVADFRRDATAAGV
ncbi:gamma-glutamyltransferase family protein [Paracandidimonas soli]|uniref:gamma-glutamyltransferase family protein n=1 Tax=Paracandidimonas soli TaxID=1917182 RepID=UPI003340F896